MARAELSGSFLRKELGEALRNTEITQEYYLLTLGPGGASDFL